MPKNIIFCADGTWNGPGETDGTSIIGDTPTNVFDLFTSLAGQDSPGTLSLADEQERYLTDANGVTTQAAKYIHGVGDSRNFLVKVLGGALGAGLITRIVRGYTFVSRVYQPGDNIFLIGFSRGAYTARALGGLIAQRGLLDGSKLDLTDKVKAYRAGAAVWYDTRKTAISQDPSLLGKLEELAIDLPAFLTLPPTTSLIPNVPMAAIAVWETVGSLGIPEFNAQHENLEPMRFINTQLSPLVATGIHAMALDEKRSDFTPTLWDADPRITQIVFPGAHADVGGGYPANECGLSNGALKWMTDMLTPLGVQFAAPLNLPAPDPAGPAHQPWTQPPFNLMPTMTRALPAGTPWHSSINDRMAAGPVPPAPGAAPELYRPTNLP